LVTVGISASISVLLKSLVEVSFVSLKTACGTMSITVRRLTSAAVPSNAGRRPSSQSSHSSDAVVANIPSSPSRLSNAGADGEL